jgi:HKD family nuclease
MPETPCPFCSLDPARVFFESDLVFGVWDAFAVSDGHALVVTRRHVASWFDATPSERAALTEGFAVARESVLRTHAPDGFNIGINVGDAAGQTIPHLHVHVIPRYAGDVPDPRGGVRHVIPGRGNYLTAKTPAAASPKRLVTGGEDPLLPHIVLELAAADRADIVVSFVLGSGLDRVFEHFRDLLGRGKQLRILTGDYLGITEPDALMRLLDLEGDVVRRVYETGSNSGPAFVPVVRSFHPKAYIFSRGAEGTAFVGSSNLSLAALTSAVEWNYRVVSSREGGGFAETVAAFETLFRHPSTRELLPDWIERYRARRTIQRPIVEATDLEPEPQKPPVEPNEVQVAALEALQTTRAEGHRAGLVVLATGLGKTWLSAFDTNRPEFRRVLFVAHREEILGQAHATFRRIRPGANLGHYTGDKKQGSADVLFASIQTRRARQGISVSFLGVEAPVWQGARSERSGPT